MNEQQLQQAFLQFLAQKTGAKNEAELKQAIQKLGREGIQQAYQEFMQVMQQQQVKAAKFGAKLNYIRHLRGECPEGTEMQYFKVGGRLCKKCMKKEQDGGTVGGDPVDAFKCGRKMKKKKCATGGAIDSKAQGGAIDSAKCGKKMKKKAVGGTMVEQDKCGKKLKKKADGGDIDYNNTPTYSFASYSKATLAKCGAKLKEAAKKKTKKNCGGAKMAQGGTVNMYPSSLKEAWAREAKTAHSGHKVGGKKSVDSSKTKKKTSGACLAPRSQHTSGWRPRG